jgi:tRNA(adenine34) deaminase
MMRLALEEARQALHLGEVPIGAVLAHDQEVIASGFNQPIHAVDPTSHAEIVAMRKAARELGNYRLGGLTLYVTVEPCMMCIGAIVQARVANLVYGASEPKFGAVESLFDLNQIRIPHRLSISSGVLEQDCKKILQDFFKFRRENV